MNKIIIVLSVIAMAGAASAVRPLMTLEDSFSELSVVPGDDEETRYLPAQNKIFGDFCIKSRDTIKSYIVSSANHQAADVFEAIFSSVNDLGTDIVKSQDATVAQSASIIAAQTEHQDQSVIQLMIEGTKAVIRALIETAESQLFERIALLKAQFTSEGLKDKISAVCNSVSYDLKQQLENRLAETRNAMKASASKMGAEGASMVDTISKARYDNIGCLTVGRVVKVQMFCNILNVAGNSIYPLLGL